MRKIQKYFKKDEQTIEEKLIDILRIVKDKITDDSYLDWTWYETAEELRNVIQGFIDKLSEGDYTCLDELNVHFAVTSTFQEHSLNNGWSSEYLKLAEKFDNLYINLKK